jgi:putative ABC transporter-associated repeat protein
MIGALVGMVLAVLSPIADGHVDMGPRFADGRWSIQIRDDTASPVTWRNLSDVVLQAADTAKVTIPEDKTYSFLGKPGDPVWLLPQVQKPGILWPGWNTQDPEVVTTVNREVTWKLTGVDGPGRFTLFLNGEFGAPQMIFDSTKPFPQETGIEVNTHVHGNWAFSAPGTYALTVAMTGTTKAGTPLSAGGTLRIQVGSEPVSSAPPPVTPVAAVDPPRSTTWWWIVGGVVVVVLGLVVWKGRRGSSS